MLIIALIFSQPPPMGSNQPFFNVRPCFILLRKPLKTPNSKTEPGPSYSLLFVEILYSVDIEENAMPLS